MPAFYDSHCHMMNLSHPNLTAMIKRTFKGAIPGSLIKLFDSLNALPLALKLIIWLLLFLPLLIVLTLAVLIGLVVVL